MPLPYLDLLRRPGAAAFSAAGLVGRLPIAMVGLGIVMLVTSRSGSYALAGALSAVCALAAAVGGPYGSRAADRWGQHRAVPVLAGLHVAALLGFVAAVVRGWPVAAQVVLVAAAGAATPNIGALVRARWAALLAGTGRLRPAFALESVLDEVLFVVGPPLATVLALQVADTSALLAAAVLVAAGSALLAPQRRSQPVPARRSQVRGGPVLRAPGVPVVVGVMVLMGGVFGAFEVTTVAFARQAGAAGAAGVLLALYAAGSLVAGLVVGALHLRAPLARQLLACVALLAVVSAPLPWVRSAGAFAVVAFLAGLAVSPVLIAATALVERLVPAQRLTEGLTVAGSGITLGVAASASAAGAAIDRWGPPAAYGICAGSAAAALAAVAASARRLGAAERAAAGAGPGALRPDAPAEGPQVPPGAPPAPAGPDGHRPDGRVPSGGSPPGLVRVPSIGKDDPGPGTPRRAGRRG